MIGLIRSLTLLCGLSVFGVAEAQQFNSDNQWTAPHGVATLVATAGEEYSAFLAVAALYPRTEFNVGVTRFIADRDRRTDAHNSGIFYIKRTMRENADANGGWSLTVGTGVNPSYLNEGEITHTFQSWFATAAITFPFRDGDITWDLLPGFNANFDKDQSGNNALNATYSTRVAVYKLIPHSALVGELFGTAGEQHTDPQYRAGVRWESPKLIMALTYGRGFDGTGGPRWEFGAMYLTEPINAFCWGHSSCGK